MPAILERCRSYIEKVYREKLSTEFSDSICQVETGRQPVWRFVSADDLTSETHAGDGAAGVLLDPEIGLVSYLVPFHSRTSLRQQIICAMALGSRLSIEAESETPVTGAGDPRGPWHVIVTWLVDAEDRQSWIEDVAEVRRETPFSEDVSLDAIFLGTEEDLESQLDRYGFPRLLLQTRSVLKKQKIEDVTRWMSADDLVRAALTGFPSRFQKPEQRELAKGVVDAMEKFDDVSGAPNVVQFQNGPTRPRLLNSIRIENFRNLESLTLDFGNEGAGGMIIHGSNGTGKTSLCEAISLAMSGSSSAYRAFADRTREKDVSVTDRGREYLGGYLASVQSASGSGENAQPRIALNEEALSPPQLALPAETCSAEVAMDGTILPQGTSLVFAHMPAQELGARILRGYSALADYIEEYAESSVLRANTNRQDFLRTFGLSTSITKVDTAFERMARRETDRSLPGFPRPLVEWLDTIQVGAQLAWRWQEWGNESSRNALGVRLSQMDTSPSNLEAEIRSWLEEFNNLVALSQEVLKNVEARIGAVRPELDQLATRTRAWGEWLGAHKAASVASSAASQEPSPLAGKLDKLQAEQQRIVEQGRNAARHFDHLAQVDAYVRETWGKEHPDQCPTCGAGHAEQGGIVSVIQSWREQTAAERDRMRREYTRLKTEIDDLQKGLADHGQGQCPIGAGEQARIVEALKWLVPGEADFREWIAAKSQREELIAVILALRNNPVIPANVDAENEAGRVARDLAWQFADARQMFEAPSNWKPVKEKLTALLADIVNQHLPHTLGALWSELFLNLTPAPWLLPDRPSIDVACKRGEQRSTLQVKGRLARYILNQSEVNILGLGWFFTRYLTRGRFSHACLVMDDPAESLDQAGFRDLCRFWGTLIRLHRVYERPFHLVVTLGQENRAMEAARATGG
ncbi:MAG: hypothetical protein EHM18_08145, partial [Acidobacteria bacterium]